MAEIDNQELTLRVLKISGTGQVTFTRHNETNINDRYQGKLAAQKAKKEGKPYDLNALLDEFFQRSISPTSLFQMKARRVTVSPIGDVNDSGFKA